MRYKSTLSVLISNFKYTRDNFILYFMIMIFIAVERNMITILSPIVIMIY